MSSSTAAVRVPLAAAVAIAAFACSTVADAAAATAAPGAAGSPFVPRYSLSLLGSYRKSMQIEGELTGACAKYGLPVPLARAVLMYESGGNDNLISGAGARGYFQVMPSTYRLMRVTTNIEAGVKYLSQLLSDYGREDDALAAYNGGPGRLNKGRKLPIETLQYVVGVGTYRTLLTVEEAAIRAEAGRLEVLRTDATDSWATISARTGIPVLELRLYNAFLAPRPLKAGMLIAYPRSPLDNLLAPGGAPGAPSTYTTRRGDNYLLLGFAFDVDLDQFRTDNSLWRVQVPFEGLALSVNSRPPRLVPPSTVAQPVLAAPDPLSPALTTAIDPAA